MNKRNIIYLTIAVLVSIISGCKKDGTMVTMKANPAAPAIITLPDLTLQRTDAANVLEFVGTPVDPGFRASANYYLEASLGGSNFAEAATIYSGVQDTSIKITVGDLNGILLKYFPSDQASSLDFRIRAVLVVDAGTGAPGTGTQPFEYSSAVVSETVTIYGFPRLDVIGSGTGQKIESPLGNGSYSGFVKLDDASFTLKNPDTGVVYGTDGSLLAVDGAAFAPSTGAGWYKLSADTQALTYSFAPYKIGLVGSATPHGWDAPDQKMDYDAKTNTWRITLTLTDGDIKFRLNDDWGWNLGGTTDNLVHNGSNITVTAGNYTIALTITVAGPNGSEAGTYTITKN
jgi:starch-binding outer membrane protein SusE/F